MSQTAQSKKMIILAIDDDPSNLKALTRIFNEYDEYTLHCFSSGAEGLEKVAQLMPDLILLDIQMPGISGYDVCQQVKTNPKTRNIMVLLLSGMANLLDRLQGYEVEADDYLTKPFDQQELFAKVKILLRLKEAQDQLREVNSELTTLVDLKTREVVRKERQALVGQMVLGIIHNLRGPLTSAKGMADLAGYKLSKVLNELKDESVQFTALQSVEKNLRQSIKANDCLADMIGTMLKKGRFDAQQSLQQIDINELIKDEIEFLNADLFFKHNLKKELICDEELPTVYGVSADFSQLCYNLMQNAVDAMQSAEIKELTVTTSFDEKNIEIRFKDTGPGVKPGCETKIFEPFFTTKPSAEEVTDGEAVGTGLGLYTCMELVKLYDGTIMAESLPGGGAVFTVAIPRSNTSKTSCERG